MGLMHDAGGIDLNCAHCGELRLDAGGMTCHSCGDVETVCFQCIEREDSRRFGVGDRDYFCRYCREAMDDDD
jgi:hypothetical protein